MKRLIAALSCALLLLLGATSAGAATQPTPSSASGDDQAAAAQEIDQLLQEFDVPAETREELIASHLAGETWDSLRGDVEPESVEQRRIDGFDYTIRRYPDGSFHASGLEVPTAVPSSGITPFASITGCGFSRVGGSARYSNCTVREVLAPIRADFRADYRMDAGQNTAQITYAGAPGVIIAGGSASNVRVVMVRSSYAPGIPARAELRFTGSAQGWAGVALWVQLQVIPTGAVALSNFDIV